MIRVYEKRHIDFLKEIAPGKTKKDIVKLFKLQFPTINMTDKKMKALCGNYKIKSGVVYRPPEVYTQEQKNFIKEIVPGHSNKFVCEKVFERFGIKISESNLDNIKHKLSVKSGIVGGQFQKGQVSFNKGKTWAEFMSEEGQKKSRMTTFKKGNMPKNHRDVGSERTSVNGYIEVKVAEPNKWKMKHIVIWEKRFGKVPKGSLVIFLDKNPKNVGIENLVLITRAELARLNQNHFIFENGDYTKTALNLIKLNEKINEKGERRCQRKKKLTMSL